MLKFECTKENKKARISLLEELNNAQKTQFEEDWENAMTLEEARALLHKKIDEQWANNKC